MTINAVRAELKHAQSVFTQSVTDARDTRQLASRNVEPYSARYESQGWICIRCRSHNDGTKNRLAPHGASSVGLLRRALLRVVEQRRRQTLVSEHDQKSCY